MGMGSLARLGLLALCWGSSFLWIKIALAGLSPLQITLGRLALGALVMVVFCLVTKVKLPTDWRTWGLLAVPAVSGAALPFTLFGIGEQSVDSNLAGVLNATTPIMVVVLSFLAGVERRPGWPRIAGVIVGFAGVVVILSPWRSAGGSVAGALSCLAAAALYAVSYIFVSRFLSGRVQPAALTAGQLLVATVLVGIATPFATTAPVSLSWPVVASVVVLGLAGTGLGMLLNYRLIADDGPTLAAMVGYLLPAVSVILGALVLSEKLDALTIGGMLLVLGGVALTRVRTDRPGSRTTRITHVTPTTSGHSIEPVTPPLTSANDGELHRAGQSG
ncbi:DMT family transporter [Fodinicola acaciae]|uniref:DMT family transporter n=1 Tax=Fodinicola acaciae TaxID=2681555 RepID=UPI0013CF7A74|nr:DMT family transporter [Fodinicola acaciae]